MTLESPINGLSNGWSLAEGSCGKTSTAMLPGETILADDLTYLRNIDGICRAVNVEAFIPCSAVNKKSSSIALASNLLGIFPVNIYKKFSP